MGGEARRAWTYAICAAMTMAINGYDGSTFNSVQGFKTFVDHFKKPGAKEIDPNLLGAINTGYTTGGIVSGVFVTPTLSKLAGRRICLQVGCALVIISTFVQVFAPNVQGFIGGRLLMGIGQGIAIPTGPTYMTEIAPARIRGVMMSFWQVFFTIGAFIVYWTAYGVSKNHHLGIWQWRVPLFLQIFFPALVIISMFFCPESPRWLVERGRIEEARNALILTRPQEEAEQELADIVAAVNYEKTAAHLDSRWWAPYKTIFVEPSLRRRMLLAIFINFGQQVCGNSVLAGYTSLIYKSVFANPDTIFLINALSATFSILFTLNATWLVDRIGRKPVLLIGAAGQGISLLIVACVGITHPADAEGHRTRSVGIGVAALFFLFVLFYKPSWGATVWIYSADIFSTDVRAHAISFCSQTQSTVGTIVGQFFPIFLKKTGFYCFFFFAGMNIILFAGVWFWLPETKGIPLEDMDKLFGGVSHREAGEALDNEKVEANGGTVLRYDSREAALESDKTKQEVKHIA
ncbi:putative quinate permease [Vanrija pseudolonga]|uniref:Quinate permease n=1 Tax=Vanrija pseudolonga TaxID=143232 RepID=A0AAF1BTZ8_9TREE|nr:putative quinate permease [Vanrija pseudolonga]